MLNLELKNISYSASLSEETSAYSATLYLDGKKVAQVSNHGTGGCDEQYWFDRAAEAKITAYFKTLPERDTGMELEPGKPFMVQPDLEDWCGQTLEAWLNRRDYKRALSRSVVTTDGTSEWTWKVKPADLGKPCRMPDGSVGTMRAAILAKRAGVRFVNDFTDAELDAHIKAMVAAHHAEKVA